MDALTLGTFLSPILTVTTVWNTRETGDIDKYKTGIGKSSIFDKVYFTWHIWVPKPNQQTWLLIKGNNHKLRQAS